MSDLSGKTILICGASSGLGKACALAAADAGARLVLNGRRRSELEKTLAELPGQDHVLMTADLTATEDRAELAQAAPCLDGLVFSAGVHRIKPIKYLDDAAWEETFSLNHRAPCLLTALLLKAKKVNATASLVYLGSIAAEVATVGNALYAGSKGALFSTVRVLALELARQRIRANVVSPGQVATGMTEKNATQVSAAALEQNAARYPLGLGEPPQVAALVRFLLSDESNWITGQNFTADGGYTLA